MDQSIRLSLEELFSSLDIPQMEDDGPTGPGNPGYSFRPMLNALVLMPLSNESESGLATFTSDRIMGTKKYLEEGS